MEDSGLHVDRSFKELVWNGMGDPDVDVSAEEVPVAVDAAAVAPVTLSLAAETVALTAPDGPPAMLAEEV